MARAAAGQRSGQDLDEQREAVALVPGGGGQGTRRIGEERLGIAGRTAAVVDDRTLGQQLALVARDPDLAGGDRAGGHVVDQRLLARPRHAERDRIDREAPVRAAERRHLDAKARGVDEVQRDQTGGRGLLGPGADPAHVAAVAHADHRDAVCAGALDAELDRFLRDHLAEPLAAVDHHDRAGVRHDLNVPVRRPFAGAQQLDVGRDPDHAVAVVAHEVGLDQMIGHGLASAASLPARSKIVCTRSRSGAAAMPMSCPPLQRQLSVLCAPQPARSFSITITSIVVPSGRGAVSRPIST